MSLSTMAAARQNEMNVSMAVVATSTLGVVIIGGLGSDGSLEGISIKGSFTLTPGVSAPNQTANSPDVKRLHSATFDVGIEGGTGGFAQHMCFQSVMATVWLSPRFDPPASHPTAGYNGG